MLLSHLRQTYHQQICTDIIRAPKGYPNFADGSNTSSLEIAWGIVRRLCGKINASDIVTGQKAGDLFESITAHFLNESFDQLNHLRPGDWFYSTNQTDISNFEQYVHLADLSNIIKQYPELSTAFGGEYIVRPDIIIARSLVSDEEINSIDTILEPNTSYAAYTSIRETNRPFGQKFLHASISCKWTIRSDRSQNSRTEALNLIRHRKGHVPHIVAVTAEPLPSRIATLALGTGDLDCVYHFALPELYESIQENNNEGQLEILKDMIDGKRLRDISDLPFDLAT